MANSLGKGFSVLIVFFSSASATQIDKCRVLGSVERAVEVERQNTYLSVTFQVKVQEIEGGESTDGTWCKEMAEARNTETGTIIVTTGQGTDEPTIFDKKSRWYEWSFLDAGEHQGESFGPEKP